MNVERFWARIESGDGDCWLWTGGTSTAGYGYVTIAGDKHLCHRLAYELMVGEIPAGLQLDHLCRVPRCVNPEHLDPVTAWVNNMRSNSLAAQRARMTECSRGHEFTPENTYYRPDRRGGRMCRRCCQLREARRVRDRRSAA